MSPDTTKLQRRAFEIAVEQGYGTTAARAYQSVRTLTGNDPLRLVDDSVRAVRPPAGPSNGTVLVPLVPGGGLSNYRAAVLAKAFQLRGYETVVLHCDKGLFRCLRRSAEWDSPAICELCCADGRRVLDGFELDFVSVSDLAPDTSISVDPEAIESFEYRGIDLAGFTLATARQHLQKYTVDPTGGYDREVCRDLLKNAVRLTDVYETLFERHDVVATITWEDHYIHGGIPLALSRKHGVPGYSIEPGFLDGTMVFGSTANRNTLPFFSNDTLLDERMATPLTTEQRQTVRSIVDRRIDGRDAMHQYSSGTGRSLDVGEYETVVGMFTNLIWDASLDVTEVAPYSDVLEWIADTVERFAEMDDSLLILKTHPAEAVHGTNQPVSEYVRSTCGPLPSNVRLLPPDTDVDTYELIQDLDVGVVFNTTVGIEMAFQGMPVVVGGDTHYRNQGITHDPESKAAYSQTLGRVGDLEMTDEMRARAERYMYFFLVQKCIDVTVLTEDTDPEAFDERPVTMADIRPGNEPMDFVVDRIVAGEQVVRETRSEERHDVESTAQSS